MILLLGPSASGKTEIAKFIEKFYKIKKAVTSTTREMRNGEINGVSYFFYSEEEFLDRLEKGLFVEHTIYNGHYYGTGIDQVANDKCIILDPEGIRSFQKLNDPTIVTFYLSASEKTREARMKERGDKEEDIEKRLKNDEKTFAPSSLPPYDILVETDGKPLDFLAFYIHHIYACILEQRGFKIREEFKI